MGLFSNSVPTAKFLQVGDSCTGTIVEIGQTQRTEFKRDGSIGDPMFWSGGKPVAGAEVDPRSGQPNQPVMDHVITLETGQPDENGETQRRIFVKGKSELASIKEACIAAGVRDVELGGKLQKTWASGGRPGGADVDNPRVYSYRYAPPKGGVTAQAPAPAPVAPAQTAAAVHEAMDRMQRAHASSPVLNKTRANPGFEEEPPF